MESKIDLLDTLTEEIEVPEEVEGEIINYLSISDLVNLACTSKKYYLFFKPVADLQKLLHYVVRSEYLKASVIAKQNENLIFRRGQVVDCSGRVFHNISAVEYAIWSLDTEMLEQFICNILINSPLSIEETYQMVSTLSTQYNKATIEGISYTLNGKRITEKHFDFNNTIIKELQTQLDLLKQSEIKNLEQINKQWVAGVGGSQKLLPMSAIFLYCSDFPFFSEFDSLPLLFEPHSNFYNPTDKSYEHWFNVDSKLGIDFALYKGQAMLNSKRGHLAACTTKMPSSEMETVRVDLCAIKKLFNLKKERISSLKTDIDFYLTDLGNKITESIGETANLETSKII